MSARKILGFGAKTVVLTIVLAIVMIGVSGAVLPAETVEAAPESGAGALIPLFIVCLVDAVVLGLVIHQSRWRGLSLILGVAFAFYGVQTVVGQIEAIVFLTPLGERWGAGSIPVLTMPMEFILSQFAIGAAMAVVGVTLAAFLFRKVRSSPEQPSPLIPRISARQWLWKLGVVIVLYELLYFGFGYFVAWKDPAVLSFYQGTDPGSFFAQMKNVATHTPALIPFQALRALLWTAFALPVISMLQHKGWAGALLTGLFVALPMNIPHIVPNAYMPPAVRFAHFIETASSTFIFGMLMFWLFHRAHHSIADLWGMANRRQRLKATSHQFGD